MQHTPYWWDQTHLLDRPLSQPSPATSYDALIVGAGLTGLSAAITFAKAGKSVVVVEASRVGLGASSRNGGMVGGGHRLSYKQLSQQHGADTAKALIREAHLDSTAFTKQLIADEGIDCDLSVSGRLRGFTSAKDADGQARATEDLQKLIDVDARVLTKAEMQSEIDTEFFHGGVLLNQHGGLNPAAFVTGLTDAAQRRGVTLLEGTQVLSLGENGEVVTSAGLSKARQVLMATNGYTPQWAPQARRIIPAPSFLIATEDLGRETVQAIMPGGRMYTETGPKHSYFRPSPCGRRVIYGGRAALVNIPLERAALKLRSNLETIFPSLKGVALSHVWTGTLGFAFDHMPNIGRIDGIWHAMGYSGNGNTMAPFLGAKAANLMMGLPEGETAFTQTPLPAKWYYRGLRDAAVKPQPDLRPLTKSPWFMPAADLWWRGKEWLG